MKRHFILFFILTSCIVFAQNTYKDGVYFGTYDFNDSKSWKPQLEITIKGNKIVLAKMDYINATGSLKSADKMYANTMKPKSGIAPQEAYTELNKKILSLQKVPVDSVTGATTSTKLFNELAKAILIKAQKGDKSSTVLPMNTTYTASDKPDGRGYTATLAVTYTNGAITAVNYNEFDAKKQDKKSSDYVNSEMLKTNKTTWKDAIGKLEASLLKSQNTFSIDTVTGASSSSQRFIELSKVIASIRGVK
ncbi:MAG: hypothetical protein A2015_15465 [Spirochaetes bacterium GWF1_31_7]|nr:MAG: hypothetical protein A2Y30_11885 [Spirochaetes bacterium GWE1_32_154]OHD47264.1 MAG: hypothetical protein A2Y29_02900 [Spirochaetes bacterium GWE2_31_10]OHD52136.1 MAG: hypothetical protein A2015_15465 [Spirochaetes bacterium GWF1_31_7]OHD83002.1 MAG: hypothetical protein A2355_10400 [Spirochaetes bacterium RIFOXYB1_FULL_32_8]HBD96320.1 hypothetical protein [Spirochaetia bacterium]